MASSKAKSKKQLAQNAAIKTYRAQARKLKKQHLINFDLRGKLTSQKKAAIARQWAKYRHVIEPRPSISTGIKKEYVKRRVCPKTALKFKEHGYTVHGQTVWVPTDRYEKVKIISRKGKYEQQVKIIRSGYGKHSEEKLYVTGADIFEDIKEAMKLRPLNPGMFVSVKIGDHNHFSVNLPVDSYEELMKYLTKWQPKDDLRSREMLLSSMKLIYIH